MIFIANSGLFVFKTRQSLERQSYLFEGDTGVDHCDGDLVLLGDACNLAIRNVLLRVFILPHQQLNRIAI